MARSKGMQRFYHKRPDGSWAPCSNPHKCPYRNHKLDAHEDPNLASGDELHRRIVATNEYTDLVAAPENNNLFKISIEDDSSFMRTPRDMAEMLKEESKTSNLKPFYSGTISTELRDGFDRSRIFTAKRMETIGGWPPRAVPGWEISVIDGFTGQIIDKQEHYVYTDSESKAFKQDIVKMVHRDLCQGVYGDGEENREKVNAIANKKISSIYNALATVETLERGPKEAQRVGFSYFKNSTPAELVATARYKETGFTGAELSDFLKDSKKYKYEMPDISVSVYEDKIDGTDCSWTMTGTNGSWMLTTKTSKGTKVHGPFQDLEDMGTTFEDAYQGEGVNSMTLDIYKDYIGELMDNVRDSTAEHDSRVIENLHTLAKNDPAFRKRYYDKIGRLDPELEAQREGSEPASFINRLFGRK